MTNLNESGCLSESEDAALCPEGIGGFCAVHEEHIGNVLGAIWEHYDGMGLVWYNITFYRTDEDDEGQRNRSLSFRKEDIPLLIKVADRCHEWLLNCKRQEE